MGKDSEKGKYSSPEGSRTWEYLSSVIVAIGMACVGNMLGWNSPSLAQLNSPESSIHMSSEEASTLTASFSLGATIAPPLSILVIDKVGRKNTVLLTTIPMLLSWSMIMVARDVTVLIVARVISGISLGLLCCTFPIYMVELLSANMRGSLGAIGGVACFSGTLFMFAATPHSSIKMMAGVCLGITMLFLICLWFIPESPYFLVMVNRLEEAEMALEKLRGKTDVAEEMELIKATIDRKKRKGLVEPDVTDCDNKNQNTFKLLFTVSENFRALIIGLILTTLQHFCAFHPILNYCHIILRDMGSGLDLYVATLLFGVLQIFGVILYGLIADKFGRRTLIFTSGTVSVLLLTIIATYFYLMEHTNVDVTKYGIIPLVSIFFLVMMLNVGVLTLPQLIVAEILATDVKVLGMCVISVFGTMTGTISTKFYLLMAESWGFGHSIPFFGYAVITFVCLALLAPLLPETKGKTLLEIQREFKS